MILNNTPTNEAIISNVGEIGEFRIRNSAKAFSILSSGLYANKIRAIIRELSCNAYDSHVAAGKSSVPFDVHLPNMLEPFFSIRDYGTGLTHEQVINIYTTYFESTKTGSNDFVGALGLGSKSPFSYTDNFTVTAIKNSVKGIYTAFINEVGVPSIALMTTEPSDEPNSVEVQFAVTDQCDFEKFNREAQAVFKYFKLRPNVSGNSNFNFIDTLYEKTNIIPGIHQIGSRGTSSVAVMGNIAYPIDIPNSDKSLTPALQRMLKCHLEMHFAIGELDFQASREGLSYVPQTVNAIKAKLEELQAHLTVGIAAEAEAIENLWSRAVFLHSTTYRDSLRGAIASEYAMTAALPTMHGSQLAYFDLDFADLAKNWNIKLQSLSYNHRSHVWSNVKPRAKYAKDAQGNNISHSYYTICVNTNQLFVISDTKCSAVERFRSHCREHHNFKDFANAWVISRVDETAEMDLTGFFNAIHNPPETYKTVSSLLKKKERVITPRKISIVRLTARNEYKWGSKRSIWEEVLDVESIIDPVSDDTYYYIPLNGHKIESTYGYDDIDELTEDIKSIAKLCPSTIYGVRKSSMKDVVKLKNWVNLETHIAEQLKTHNVKELVMSVVKKDIVDGFLSNAFTQNIIIKSIDASSQYASFVSKLSATPTTHRANRYNIERLIKKFASDQSITLTQASDQLKTEVKNIYKRYPLLNYLSGACTDTHAVVQYINLIDSN